MKLNKKTAGAIIFAFLILLLFFSKTIYTYNMPEVTGAKPARGSLSKLEISSGIASWAETENLYAVCAGAVGRVFVREGDYVEEGDVLFEMDFDAPAAERRYTETENNIRKLEAEIRSMRQRLNNIREALAAVYSEEDFQSYSPELLSGVAYAVRDYSVDDPGRSLMGQAGMITLELERAMISLKNTVFAYELGSQSRSDLINAENNLKALLYKYEAEADELEHSLALRSMDLDNLRLSQVSIREILRDYRNNTVVRAPAQGVILSLAVERGKFLGENAFMASIGVGDEFSVECTISLDNNFVSPGDTCDLSNASHVLKGTVRRVRPSPQGKTVTVTVHSTEVSEGETFEVTFEKVSAASFTLVPSSAINQDNDGYFVYQIKRRRGIMGDEYYLERLTVFIGDSDYRNTAVVRGITFFEPLVLVSSKAVTAGMTVTLKNPEEFFET